jgi:hypothetical protein
VVALLPENFKPAPRETKADHDGTVATLDRRLKDRVYLMIRDSFPTTKVELNDDHDSEESLLEAALRGLQEQLNSGDGANSATKGKQKKQQPGNNNTLPLELYCPSHAPLAVKLDVYDSAQQESTGYFGTKTFFLKVQYDDGTIPPKSNIDFAWLDRNEIVERIQATAGDDEAKFYRYML